MPLVCLVSLPDLNAGFGLESFESCFEWSSAISHGAGAIPVSVSVCELARRSYVYTYIYICVCVNTEDGRQAHERYLV